MAIIDRPTPAAQASPFAVRTQVTDPPTVATPKPARPPRLGYDPIPRALSDEIRDGLLKPIDELVYGVLLSFRIRLKNSCWCAKRTIAEKIGRTPRTVQSSLARLKARGWIHHHQVAVPDPDERYNFTGWRFTLLRLVVDEPTAPPHPKISPPPSPKFLPPPEPQISPKVFPRGMKKSEAKTFNVDFSIASKAEKTPTELEPAGAETIVSTPEPVPACPGQPEAPATRPDAVASPPRPRVTQADRDAAVEAGFDALPLSVRETFVKRALEHYPNQRQFPGMIRHHALRIYVLSVESVDPKAFPAVDPLPVSPAPIAPRAEVAVRNLDAALRNLISPAPVSVPKPSAGSLKELGRRLSYDPDPTLAEAFTEAFLKLCGPRDKDPDQTRRTVHAIARQVQLGAMAVDCFEFGLSEALKKGKRNPGAAFIAGIKRWKAGARFSGRASVMPSPVSRKSLSEHGTHPPLSL